MKKFFLSGASIIIFLAVLGSTFLIQNTANVQNDFTQEPIFIEKDCPVTGINTSSYKDILNAINNQQAQAVSQTKDLETQTLGELTRTLLAAIENNEDHASIIKIAKIRKQKMAHAIRNDPEQAIKWGIETSVRENLPEEIRRHIERQIHSNASNSMFSAGGDQSHQDNLRTLMVKGQTFHAFVYGNRLDQAVFSQEPIEGIALGSLMAVADDTIQSEQTIKVQEPKKVQITHTFYFHPDEVKFDRKQDFDVVRMIDSIPGESSPGSPSLPTRLASIEIPAGANVLNVSARGNEFIFKAGLEIFPAQPQTPTSQGEAAEFVQPNPAIYDSMNKFPDSVAIHDGTRRVRGKTYVTVRLNPLRYIPKARELYFAKSIKVIIDYLTPAIPPASSTSENENNLNSPLGFSHVSIQNLDESNLSALKASSVQVSLQTTVTMNYNYLIVTSNDLVDAFQPLAIHRQSNNSFSTRILTIEEINAQYDGTRPDGKEDLQTKIRNAIADYVQNHGTTHVVLGGDNTIVPDRDTYVSVGSYKESRMPTDLYYAGLDGSWDEWDMDGVYGEAYVGGQWNQHEGDLSADVLLGRIPIQTAEQATAYINKVISYETEPQTDIQKKILIAGMKLWNRYSDNQRPDEEMTDGHMQFRDSNHTTVSDAEIWSRRMYRDTVENYFNANQLSYLLDTLSSWDNGNAGSYASSRDNMIDRFNEGWNFMTYNTHGNTNIWATESGHFKDSHAMQLNNLTAFVYTIACITGAFDRERALSEGFIRNPDGGAIVYMGCSRYGWGSPGSYHGGTSLMYQRKFYEKVFKSKITQVGEAFNAHKAAYSPSSSYNGSYRWVQFGMNLQGDPAIEIKGIIENKPPEANDQSVVVNMDTPTFITLDARDPENQSLNFELLTQPEHGRLDEQAINLNWADRSGSNSSLFGKNMTYTPETGYMGHDSFTYQVSDGAYTSRVATVSITIQSSDTEPPSPPQNLVARTNGEGSILLQWTPSTDNNAVSEYNIFRNNRIVASSVYPNYNDTNLDPKTVYHYQVQAVDPVGNTSEFSEMVDIETIAEIFPPDGNIPDSWRKKGSFGWQVCNTVSSTGKMSLKAEDINDMVTAGIQYQSYFKQGTIQFDVLVSCEARFDKLTFFIDNQEMKTWSGIQDQWETVSFQITEGDHTIAWIYSKDYSGSSGDDTAWIDNVTLPATYPGAIVRFNIQGMGSTSPQAGVHSLTTEIDHPIYAMPDLGYAFEKWSATDHAVLGDPNADSTTVTLQGTDIVHIVTAHFIQINQPPEFNQDHYTLEPVSEDENVSIDLTGFASDADENDVLTFYKISGPQWLTMSPNNVLHGTPTNDNVGQNTFVIRVLDNMQAMDEAIVEIVVNNVNDAPSFISQTLTAEPATKDQAYQFSVAHLASDPDINDTLTFSKESGPQWLVLSQNGTIVGTPSEAGNDSFEIKVIDQSGAFDTATLVITVKDTENDHYAPGITVAYYDFQTRLASLPDFDRIPDLVRIESDINYKKSRNVWPELDRIYTDTYGSIHDGYIYIENAGEYTFYLKSDDGSRLWINGLSIIENDGLHGMREKSGKVSLDSGYHHFRIHFFENYGHTGLILSFKSEDMSKQVVPSEILFHCTDNKQPLITSKSFQIFDQQTQGAFIGQMMGSDPNLMDQLTYAILGQDDDTIAIKAETGELYVSNPALVAQNSGKTLELTIQISDNGEPALTDTATAWISIESLTDYAPGLRAEFFDFNEKLSSLPDLQWLLPDVIRTDDRLDYESIRDAWDGLSVDFKDTFASRHTGFIYIDTAGEYTFYLKSDDGSKMWMNNQLLINNDGLHGMREKKSTVSLEEGFHPIRIEFFENRGGAGLILSYKGPDFNKRIVPASILYQSTKNLGPTLFDQTGVAIEGQDMGSVVGKMTAFDPNYGDEITYAINDGNLNSAFEINAATGEVSILNPVAIDKAVHPYFLLIISATDSGEPAISDMAALTVTVYRANDYLPGVQSEFFNESKRINQLPDLTDRTADIVRTDQQINYKKSSQSWTGLPSEYKSNFVSRHTGYLYIDAPGIYTLYLNSDDGSKMWINGEEVIDNKGLHAMRERASMIELSQGYHHIRIEYFERTGWAGLILSYSSDFISKQVIPESMFYHTVVQDTHVPAKESTQVIANIGITDGEEEWLETDYDDEDTWFVEDYSLEEVE